jgi:NAD(P)-dependent dehydrogenase (short-subunit alcohol dehydrogenase family)
LLLSAPLELSTVEETTVAPDFAGKTALITGAGRGIGRAVAHGLGATGGRVSLLARSEGQLEGTRALLLEQGVSAQRIGVVFADLADEQQRGHATPAALAAGRGRHRHAGLDPPAGPRAHRRRPARAVQ